MNEILLQSTVNGMSDVTFTLGNLVTIVGGIVATVTTFVTLKVNLSAKQKADEKRFKDLELLQDNAMKDVKEKLIEATTKKNAMRAEIDIKMEKHDEITHKRIDAVRDDLKDYRTTSDAEFKEINKTMSEVKVSNSKIEGMIQQLLNK